MGSKVPSTPAEFPFFRADEIRKPFVVLEEADVGWYI